MANVENHHEPSTAEKFFWWAKFSGIVAGVLGIIRHSADMAYGGAALAVGAVVAEKTLYKHSAKS